MMEAHRLFTRHWRTPAFLHPCHYHKRRQPYLSRGWRETFRLSVPSSDAGTGLALVIAFHGGTDSQEDFAQQEQFDQLGEQEKFIMAYAIADQERTAAEGEWYLNTAHLDGRQQFLRGYSGRAIRRILCRPIQAICYRILSGSYVHLRDCMPTQSQVLRGGFLRWNNARQPRIMRSRQWHRNHAHSWKAGLHHLLPY